MVALFSLPSLADTPRYQPMEVAVDGSGNVYIMMAIGGTVKAGVYVYAPGGTEIISYTANDYGDIAINGNSSLYLSSIRRNYVERTDKNGSSVIFWREDRPNRFLNYIAIDRNGTVYISDFNYSENPTISVSGCIMKVSPDGTVMDIIEGRPPVPMDRPFKMSVSGNGTIYIANNSGYISAIYPDGGRGTITPVGKDKGTGNWLVDVAAGEDGYLYVTESTYGCVYKLADNGTVMARWDGCGPARFSTPFGVATDGNGRVYVSDLQNQRVVWFDADRYRFGESATENVDGRGVLWDNVITADTTTQPSLGDRIMPRQSIPGYKSVIALTGLCLAGIFLYLRRVRRN